MVPRRSIITLLEKVDTGTQEKSALARMPVQWVIRPQTAELLDYRGYAGRVISGTFKINDKITILPSKVSSTISKIESS